MTISHGEMSSGHFIHSQIYLLARGPPGVDAIASLWLTAGPIFVDTGERLLCVFDAAVEALETLKLVHHAIFLEVPVQVKYR